MLGARTNNGYEPAAISNSKISNRILELSEIAPHLRGLLRVTTSHYKYISYMDLDILHGILQAPCHKISVEYQVIKLIFLPSDKDANDLSVAAEKKNIWYRITKTPAFSCS